MFTGIIKALGRVSDLEREGSNLLLTIESPISHELQVDQSVSHDGVCLTVTACGEGWHCVTAIAETLNKTNLNAIRIGSTINLERAMVSGARLDGHIVQGHVDTVGHCLSIEEQNGSWVYTFQYQPTPLLLLVDKGSICVNGVSLTVVNPVGSEFSVAIIPYTYLHTNFQYLKVGDVVNLEFDVLGKYIAKYLQVYLPSLQGKI